MTGRTRGMAPGAVLVAVALLSAPAVAGAQATQAGAAQAAPVLTLREAVDAALEANLGLETARWELAAAQAQAREAWGNVMPRVNMNASYTRNLDIPTNFLPAVIFDPEADPDELIGVQFGSDNQWYAQARATQPLFNASAFLGVGAAGRFETMQQEVVRGQAQQAATQARLRYYDVLLSDERLRLTSESVARVERVLDETQKLNQAGLASEYDVLRLEVELSNLRPNLARAENASDAARRALAVAMGVESLEGVALAGSLLEVELPPPGELDRDAMALAAAELTLDGGVEAAALEAPAAVELAMARRSELRQLRLMRELRRTERKVEISQYLPQVSLFGTWTASGQGNDEPTFFGDQRFAARAVGVEVSVPLFSGFQRPARVSRMSAVVEQVGAQLALAEEQTENEVKTLLDQLQESYARAVAQQRAVAQATRGFEIARREYTAGIGSQLQVTDSELALRQSEFNYAQAIHDYLTAQARLDAAVGVVPGVDTGDINALQD